MSEDKVRYSQKLMEFIAEAQEELQGEGLDQINQYGMSVSSMLEKAEEILACAPEEERADVSWQLYQVMVQNNEAVMETALRQPFFTAPECVHYLMNCWLRILKGLPGLAPNRVRSEIIRCENMCKEARKAYLPQRRMIYKAYMANNKGVSYGKWFREELSGRW